MQGRSSLPLLTALLSDLKGTTISHGPTIQQAITNLCKQVRIYRIGMVCEISFLLCREGVVVDQPKSRSFWKAFFVSSGVCQL